ncbi:hypothetical protein STEG23_019719, partial [Scotinomys teguina]
FDIVLSIKIVQEEWKAKVFGMPKATEQANPFHRVSTGRTISQSFPVNAIDNKNDELEGKFKGES